MSRYARPWGAPTGALPEGTPAAAVGSRPSSQATIADERKRGPIPGGENQCTPLRRVPSYILLRTLFTDKRSRAATSAIRRYSDGALWEDSRTAGRDPPNMAGRTVAREQGAVVPAAANRGLRSRAPAAPSLATAETSPPKAIPRGTATDRHPNKFEASSKFPDALPEWANASSQFTDFLAYS